MHAMSFALGAAVYHDHDLVADPAPLERLLDAFAGEKLTQFCVPLAPRKERPSGYERAKLIARVRAGELFALLVGTPPEVDDVDALMIGCEVAPTTKPSRRGYRYRADVAVGAAQLDRRTPASVVGAVVEFADRVAARAGAVFTADSTSFAHALAAGALGGSLTEEQNRRVRDVAYAVVELDGRIRGPEWGTFLSTDHVAHLGGAGALEAGAGCAVARRLDSGGMYLQLTDRLPDPSAPALAAGLDRLAAFLAPVRTP
jgi:hypothetical protein